MGRIALLGVEGEEAFIDRVLRDATEDINILLAGEPVDAIGDLIVDVERPFDGGKEEVIALLEAVALAHRFLACYHHGVMELLEPARHVTPLGGGYGAVAEASLYPGFAETLKHGGVEVLEGAGNEDLLAPAQGVDERAQDGGGFRGEIGP